MIEIDIPCIQKAKVPVLIAGKVDFNVSSYVSVKQLKQAYGKSLRKLPSANNGTKMYAYSPNNKHYGIAFTTKNNKVTHITIGTLG